MIRFFCDPTCSRAAHAANWNAVSEADGSSATAETAGATDETVATAPEQQAAEQSTSHTLEKAILADVGEIGMQIGLEPQTEEPVAEEQSEPENSEEVESEAEPTESEAEPKQLSIEEQIAAHKAKGEKPPWYLSRIAEESSKRRERTADLEKEKARAQQAEAKIQELQSQLTSVPVAPTEANPFGDVYDPNQLATLEQTYERLLEFAETHLDGAENVVVGRDKNGNEIREDIPADKISEMRYKADRALRKDIPNRRTYLVQRDTLNAQAEATYSELKEADSPFAKAVADLSRRVPFLVSSFPDAKLWIARAVRGLQWELGQKAESNGDKPSETAKKIEAAAKTKIAPSVGKTRSTIERKGADLAAANKELETRGDYESAEKTLAAMFAKRGAAKKVQPVG